MSLSSFWQYAVGLKVNTADKFKKAMASQSSREIFIGLSPKLKGNAPLTMSLGT